MILEYTTETFPVSRNSSTSSNTLRVDESLDQGHRHFSSFHWLYPGLFQPLSPTLLKATTKTLSKKIQSGGGHTGWSAAWEVCLWSRLRQSTSATTALKKLLDRFFTRNLFGLHPKLGPNKPNCVTCYAPLTQAKGDTDHRGMTTSDGSVYQMDANSGMAAGLMEMLFQSHIPGVLLFLPTIVPELSSGRVDKLTSRGGFEVNFQWSSHMIEAITVLFDSWHPWFLSQHEYKPGWFSTDTEPDSLPRSSKISINENIITFVTPNPLKVISFLPLACAEVILIRNNIPSYVALPSDSLTHLIVKQFPCKMVMCNIDDPNICVA